MSPFPSGLPACSPRSRRAGSASTPRPPTSERGGRPLPDLDQLDRLAARALDHRRPRRAETIRLFEEPHAFAAQLPDPGIEVGHRERDVIVEVTARARER